MNDYQQHKAIVKDDISLFLGQFNFDIIYFGHWEKQSDAIYHNVFLSHYKCIIVEQGNCQIYYLGKKYSLGPNDCLLIPPFTFYTAQCENNESFTFYTFHFKVFPIRLQESFIQHYNLEHILFLNNLLFPSQFEYLKKLINRLNSDETGTYLLLKHSLILILLKIIKADHHNAIVETAQSYVATSESNVVTQSLAYIQEHIQDNVKVSDLCEFNNVSQSYLYKCFKNYIAVSPSSFILQYKIKISLDLLKDSDESIAFIAEKVGFSSVYIFSNSFKTIAGISPTQFRNQYRENATT